MQNRRPDGRWRIIITRPEPLPDGGRRIVGWLDDVDPTVGQQVWGYFAARALTLRGERDPWFYPKNLDRDA